MSDSPFDELERLGSAPVPRVDPMFADRLESDLRVSHAAASRVRGATPRWRRVGVGLVAAAVVVLGVIGLDRLRAGDDGVPLEVTGPAVEDADVASEAPIGDDEAVGAQTDVDAGDDGAPGAVFEPTATPTATPTGTPDAPGDASVDATPDTAPSSEAAPVDDSPRSATPAPGQVEATPTPPSTDVRPTPTAPPAATVRPLPEPTPTPAQPEPRPTTVRPAATPQPRPTMVGPPTATPTPPTATPTPLPTATPAPVGLPALSAVRTDRDVLGVLCEWQSPGDVDIARFTLHRTRNGGARELVATVRSSRTQAVDRAVQPGDTIIYVITGLTGDQVRAVSERIVVQVPPA